jgi:DNA-binding CsgD family transcriptional regulator
MEQLWLVLSLLSLVTGFGLVVALLVLTRLAPLPLPPVVWVVAALLSIGFANVSGVYLSVLEIPRFVLLYKLINAVAWGAPTAALLSFVLASGGGGRARGDGRAGTGGRGGARDTAPTEPHGATAARHPTATRHTTAARSHSSPRTARLLPPIAAGLVVVATWFSVHPRPGSLLTPYPVVMAAINIGVALGIAALGVVVAIRSLARSRTIASRPWRAVLQGLGIALVVLIPAQVADLTLGVVAPLVGGAWRDGFLFAVGFGVANVVLIVSLIESIRMTSSAGDATGVPPGFVDTYGLTPRELEITEGILAGRTYRQIGELLFISPRTVETHVQTIFRKCGVNSRARMVRLVTGFGDLARGKSSGGRSGHTSGTSSATDSP